MGNLLFKDNGEPIPGDKQKEVEEETPRDESNQNLEINTKVAAAVAETETVKEASKTDEEMEKREKEVEVAETETVKESSKTDEEMENGEKEAIKLSSSSASNVESVVLAKLQNFMIEEKTSEDKEVCIEEEEEIIVVEEVAEEMLSEVAEDFVIGRRFANKWMRDKGEDEAGVIVSQVSLDLINPYEMKS